MTDKINVNLNLPKDTDQALEDLAVEDKRGKGAEIAWLVEKELQRRQETSSLVVKDSLAKG